MSIKKRSAVVLCILVLLAGVGLFYHFSDKNRQKNDNHVQVSLREIKLSDPVTSGGMPLNDALYNRRSVREYADSPIKESALSNLLWSAAGISDPDSGLRTVPSAGALYPLEIYVAVGFVENFEPGLYKYSSDDHVLHLIRPGDFRNELYEAAIRQVWIREAAAVILISAVFERTSKVYGDRSERYVYIEAGHCAQNIYLQAEALSIGTTAVGAFNDTSVSDIFYLPSDESPIYLLPLGMRK